MYCLILGCLNPDRVQSAEPVDDAADKKHKKHHHKHHPRADVDESEDVCIV